MRIAMVGVPMVVISALVLMGVVFSVGLVYAQDATDSDTETANDCSSGVAVPDPADNPGLVSDCETLLEVRDTLAGSGSLNWSADIPMADWDGVARNGTPERVTQLTYTIAD